MNQKKRNNSNIVKVLMVLLIISFILYYFDNVRFDIESYSAEKGTIEKKYEGKGILIKDEEIYYSDYTGTLKQYYSEGDRIKKGTLVSSVYPNMQAAGISGEIDKINRAIAAKENSQGRDEKLEYLKELENEIQFLLIENKYEEAFETLKRYEEDIGFSNEYTNMNLDELYSKRNELSSSISNNSVPVYSKNSGIISYEIDQAEEIFMFDEIDSFNSGDYNIINLEEKLISKEKIEINEPIIKIINNFNYYIMIDVQNIIIENDKYINVRLKKIDEIVQCNIVKKQVYNSNTFLIIEVDKYFHEFFNERYIDIELILDKYEGIKIENSSIIEKDGKKGVYVIGASKIVRFYPIKVLGNNQEKSIIEEGTTYTVNSRGQIELNGQSYFTVKLYDKIISDPNEVSEGQILK
jgi:putative membrane fusion protein